MTKTEYMIHFVYKIMETLQPYIPLMQTLVWPVFVLILICVFRSQLGAFIKVVLKRIEEGGGIDAWGLKLPPMTQATPQDQAKKLKDEVAEDTGSSPPSKEGQPPESQSLETSIESMKSYMLAEDLALKKISAEQSLKITRHVKSHVDARFIFDGVALDSKRFIAIEVKMLRNASSFGRIAPRTLDQLKKFYDSLEDDAKRHFCVILAIVIQDGDVEDIDKEASDVKKRYGFHVDVICYHFTELQAEFGVK